jgi:hypothetical protein
MKQKPRAGWPNTKVSARGKENKLQLNEVTDVTKQDPALARSQGRQHGVRRTCYSKDAITGNCEAQTLSGIASCEGVTHIDARKHAPRLRPRKKLGVARKKSVRGAAESKRRPPKGGTCLMPSKQRGARANDAPHPDSFASSRNGTSPPKRKPKEEAPEAWRRSGAKDKQQESAYPSSNAAQAQSPNGSEPPEITIVKIPRYAKGRYTVVIPDDLLRDKRMKGWPAWIVCLALSKPRNWKLRQKWLRQEFGLPKRLVGAAMKRAVEVGHAKLKIVRVGQRFDKFYLVRAALDLPWSYEPKTAVSQGVISEPFRNGRIINDTPSEYRPISNDTGASEKPRSGSAKPAHESNGAEVSSSLPSWIEEEKKKHARSSQVARVRRVVFNQARQARQTGQAD